MGRHSARRRRRDARERSGASRDRAATRTRRYCSTDCQRIDWRDRGHRKACKKIRNERAAEAARAEAPPSPPKPVFYGPAPRSHADEIRARIAAEHEAARARREANPEREPASARDGSRCPICLEDWNPNVTDVFQACCARRVCLSCEKKFASKGGPCPLCRAPLPVDMAEQLARTRRHAENDVPEAVNHLAGQYRDGTLGLAKNPKKAANRAGQESEKFPTSKAHISAVFHSFWLVFGRAIIYRNGLEALMFFFGTRARGTLTLKRR